MTLSIVKLKYSDTGQMKEISLIMDCKLTDDAKILELLVDRQGQG